MGDNLMATKSWWKSKSIWTGLVAVILGSATLADQYLGTHLMTTKAIAFITAISGILGIYGRTTATTIITK